MKILRKYENMNIRPHLELAVIPVCWVQFGAGMRIYFLFSIFRAASRLSLRRYTNNLFKTLVNRSIFRAGCTYVRKGNTEYFSLTRSCFVFFRRLARVSHFLKCLSLQTRSAR